MPRLARPVRGSTTGRPIRALLDLLGRRWTLRVIWELRDTQMSFRELQGACSDMSPSVLNQRLAELRGAHIVTVTESGYALSRSGLDLLELLKPLSAWAESRAHRVREHQLDSRRSRP